MDRVPGFQELLHGLAFEITSPMFASLCTIVSGWLISDQGSPHADERGGWLRGHEALLVIPPAPEYRFVVPRCSGAGLAAFTMMEPFLGDVVMLGPG